MTGHTLTVARSRRIGWILSGALAGTVAGMVFARYEMAMAPIIGTA